LIEKLGRAGILAARRGVEQWATHVLDLANLCAAFDGDID